MINRLLDLLFPLGMSAPSGKTGPVVSYDEIAEWVNTRD